MTIAPNGSGEPNLEIDVVSDVVCPWCFVGKRQLDEAIARWQAASPGRSAPRIRWRPFQLNPEMPAAGMARSDYLLAKFGSADGAVHDRVRTAASRVGLALALERIRVQPNTLKAHGLVEMAAQAGLDARSGPEARAAFDAPTDEADAGASDPQGTLVEALFSAYFLEGRDLNDDTTLRAIATAAGVPAALIDAVLDGDAVTRLVAAADAEIRDYGVTGVPLFVVGHGDGERLAVSGAQGSDALLAVMERAVTA